MVRLRAVIGETYMLIENEELWKKDLPVQVEQLLLQNARYFEDKYSNSTSKTTREKFKVITYRVSHNACV